MENGMSVKASDRKPTPLVGRGENHRPGKHPRRVSWLEGELRKEERQTYCADDGWPIQQIVRNTKNHKTNQWR